MSRWLSLVLYLLLWSFWQVTTLAQSIAKPQLTDVIARYVLQGIGLSGSATQSSSTALPRKTFDEKVPSLISGTGNVHYTNTSLASSSSTAGVGVGVANGSTSRKVSAPPTQGVGHTTVFLNATWTVPASGSDTYPAYTAVRTYPTRSTAL